MNPTALREADRREIALVRAELRSPDPVTRQVDALGWAIWQRQDGAASKDPHLPQLLQAEIRREAAALLAGQPEPDERVWLLVQWRIADLVTGARQHAPEPCRDDWCQGGRRVFWPCGHQGACPCAETVEECRECDSTGHLRCEGCGYPMTGPAWVTPYGTCCRDCAADFRRADEVPSSLPEPRARSE